MEATSPRDGKTYDLIFDVVGATTFDRCQGSLKPNGVFLQNIMELTDVVRALWTSITGGKKIKGGVAIGNQKGMRPIGDLAAAGILKPVLSNNPIDAITECPFLAGRPPVMAEIRASIVRMATDNRGWGYTRIQGALANLDHKSPEARSPPSSVRTIKESCLDRMILVGEGSLRRAVGEFIEHYHEERPHQSLSNELIAPKTTLVGEGPSPMPAAPRRRAQVLLPSGRVVPSAWFSHTTGFGFA